MPMRRACQRTRRLRWWSV